MAQSFPEEIHARNGDTDGFVAALGKAIYPFRGEIVRVSFICGDDEDHSHITLITTEYSSADLAERIFAIIDRFQPAFEFSLSKFPRRTFVVVPTSAILERLSARERLEAATQSAASGD